MILGLHHVTATVDTAQADLDFYRDALGLRLVKKTVNFDNHNVYHFYYGDETGTPGTIWTTFPYAGWGVPVGVKGAGQIGVTSFSVPAGSLGAWIERLRARGIDAVEDQPRFGEESITFADPSGLLIELVANGRDARQPWTDGGVDTAQAIRGLHSVTMVVRTFDRTVEFMTNRLGYTVAQEMDGRLRLTVNGDGPGKTIDLVAHERGPAAKNGLGTVHHVAMAVATADEQLRFRRGARRARRQRHAGDGPAILHVHLLSRAGRRAVRNRDTRAGVHVRRVARGARTGAQTAAVGRGEPEIY